MWEFRSKRKFAFSMRSGEEGAPGKGTSTRLRPPAVVRGTLDCPLRNRCRFRGPNFLFFLAATLHRGRSTARPDRASSTAHVFQPDGATAEHTSMTLGIVRSPITFEDFLGYPVYLSRQRR